MLGGSQPEAAVQRLHQPVCTARQVWTLAVLSVAQGPVLQRENVSNPTQPSAPRDGGRISLKL